MIVHPPGISKQYAGFVVFFSIAVFIMSLMMHELGHTMIAISRGVCVSEIGIGIKGRNISGIYQNAAARKS